MTNYFSFRLLDQLVDLQDCESVTNIIKNINVKRISPLVEYVFLKRLHSIYLPSLWEYCSHPEVQLLQKVIKSPQYNHTTSLQPSFFEFFKFQSSIIDIYLEYPPWVAYQKRFQQACQLSGLGKKYSDAITGAFGEMVDNVFVHSHDPDSMILGYRYDNKEFEYVVADAGIGILASLKQHQDYSYLFDSAEALQIAIQPGESRFGKKIGRGLGFKPVLEALTKLNCKIRLRSGDYCLLLDSSTAFDPTHLLGTQLAQYDGFLITALFKIN